MAGQTVIPFFGLDRQYANLREEILDVTDRVYKTGNVLDGHFTKMFEMQMSRRCDRQYAVAVNSCTQGLTLALGTMTNQEKVLIPAISFAATINSVLMTGNEPVICDVDDSALIDLESLDFALHGAGVNTIMYANLFGNTVDYDKFRIMTDFFNPEMKIIEDAAQSFGASYKGIPSGKLGFASVLSFDPTKNLNNYGSGGMILTDDKGMYEALKDLRDNGKYYQHHHAGTNSKMSEADCAQMIVKLSHFDAWQKRRKEIADYYMGELLEFVDIVMPGPDVESSWHKFVLRTNERHALKTHLSQNGVETKFHYDKPLFELPVGYNYVDYAREPFRGATSFSRECISLPIYPELTDSEVTRVIELVEEFYR